jgi:P-type E1-E2 ATPase
LEDFNDILVIAFAVLINTLIGFFQENKTESSLEQLKKMVKRQARVIRQGQKKEILAENLVPGDLIAIGAGDIIPADARLIDVHNFQVIEAALTGESEPSLKNILSLPEQTTLADRENMVYMGTSVGRGTATARPSRFPKSTSWRRTATSP